MTIAWMTSAVIVGLLVAVAAHGAQAAARVMTVPVRWIWASAIALALLLPAAAAYRATHDTAAVAISVRTTDHESAAVGAESSSLIAIVRRGVNRARAATAEVLGRGAGAPERVLPPSAARYAVDIWVALSTILLALFIAVHARLRRARHAWPATELHGARVRVAPRAGPAVIGALRPEIIVPRWLLLRDPGEQRIVIAHELEHVRAHDPLLLALGCLAIAFMPWNPALWWFLSRLRLAVELDCDGRVLQTDVAPHTYGTLLINVAEHGTSLGFGAPALVDDTTHLQQRIMAMKPQHRRFARARGGAAATFALVSLLVACEAKLPTASEIAGMDAASAERAANRAGLLTAGDTTTVFTIDGKVVTAAQVRALQPEVIDGIEIVRGKAVGGGGTVAVRTKLRGDTIALRGRIASDQQSGERARGRVGAWGTDSASFSAGQGRVGRSGNVGGAASDMVTICRECAVTETSVDTMRINRGTLSARGTSLSSVLQHTGGPLVYIDGIRADRGAIDALNRDQIVSVEVIKGAAAARLYPGATDGVITIVTRHGASKPN